MALSIFRSGTLAAGDVVTLLVGAWMASEVLVLTLVQAFQQATFGAILGLAYPLLRARIAAGRGPLSPSQAAS